MTHTTIRINDTYNNLNSSFVSTPSSSTSSTSQTPLPPPPPPPPRRKIEKARIFEVGASIPTSPSSPASQETVGFCRFEEMGKKQHSKDRLFITKTEWATEWGGAKSKVTSTPFKRLPFYCCSFVRFLFQFPRLCSDSFFFWIFSDAFLAEFDLVLVD